MKIPTMEIKPKILSDPFDLTGKPVKPVVEDRRPAEIENWWEKLLAESQARKAVAARQRAMTPSEIEALAENVERLPSRLGHVEVVEAVAVVAVVK